MKRCPKCDQVYADDNLNFCLIDGASLLTIYDPEPTLVLSPHSPDTPATIRPPSHSQQPSRQGVSPLFAYAAVGLLALIIGGGIVLWFNSDTKSSSSVSQNTAPSPGNSIAQNSGEANEEPKVNGNQTTPKQTQTEG